MTVSDGLTTASEDIRFTIEEPSPTFGCGAAFFQQSSLPAIPLPDATAASGYGASLFVTLGGGVEEATLPLSWSLSSADNTLPPGLVIDATRGVVRGTPFSNTAGQTYSFTIEVRDANNRIAICPNAGCPIYQIRVKGIPTDIQKGFDLPTHFYLYQNYPNPFNPSTVINYMLVEGGYVTLKVYDVLGREIAVLINEEKPVGVYEVEFSAMSRGIELPSGIYFYRLQAGKFIETKKMVLIR
ncbi:MAG: T9SS type A sorting domain-containing protein [Bacteroidetes bacterium]|nr:T9SS type A sorting domain-containing protein [Bacteroidota bacterium]